MFLFSLFWSSTTVAITTLTEYYVEDLEQIVKKKILRVLVVYDGVNYYFVDGHQEGLSVALMKIGLGRIRSRYTQSNALWTQDGEQLLNEGNEELTTLREQLRVASQLTYPID